MYTCYQSGLHAAHVVLQIHDGIDAAMAALGPLWQAEDPPTEMTALQLAALLRENGLPAVPWVGPAGPLLKTCRQAHVGGYTVLVLLLGPGLPGDDRWGLFWSEGAGHLHVAECGGPGDMRPRHGPLVEHLAGQMVVVEEDPGPNRIVLAARVVEPT